MPFDPDSPKAALRRDVMTLQYNMDGPEWENISEGAKSLVREMLKKKDERITVSEILSNSWVRQSHEHADAGVSFGNEYFVRLRKCKAGMLCFLIIK